MAFSPERDPIELKRALYDDHGDAPLLIILVFLINRDGALVSTSLLSFSWPPLKRLMNMIIFYLPEKRAGCS